MMKKIALWLLAFMIAAAPALADSQGSATGGTAGTQSTAAGCVYHAVAPVLTNNQQITLQCDVNGNLATTGGGGGGGGNVNLTGINGVTPLVGAGATGTGSPRTTQAQDTNTVAGAAPLTTGVYVTGPSAAALATSALQTTGNTSAGTTATNTGNTATSTAASAASLGTTGDTVCATGAGTCTIPALIKYLNNAVSADPCGGAKTPFHFSSTSSGGNLITGTAAKITYICSLRINTSTAANVSLCEATGTACTGGTPAAVYGNTGVTAANGTAYAANGGEAPGDGGYTIAKTATTGQNVDVLFTTTNTPQVNVDGMYVQQ